MLRVPGLLRIAILVPAVWMDTAGAQDSTRHWRTIPILAAGLHVTSEPRGHSAMVLGASMTFERTMGDRAAIRPFVSAYRHQLGSAGSNLSIEYPVYARSFLAAKWLDTIALLLPL